MEMKSINLTGVWKNIYLDVKKAINHYYECNITNITLKLIRKYLEIEASDKSKINFIWRILNHLEEKGYLIRIGKRTPKHYQIAKFPIENNIIFANS